MYSLWLSQYLNSLNIFLKICHWEFPHGQPLRWSMFMSKILNLREGSYSYAKWILYKVYDYVYLQVQAIPRGERERHYSREPFIFLIHLPIIMHTNHRAHYLHLFCKLTEPVRHRPALGYELSPTFPNFLGCSGSRYEPCSKVFDCRCGWSKLEWQL